jgi:outer membrane biosynthesis protein TonB
METNRSSRQSVSAMLITTVLIAIPVGTFGASKETSRAALPSVYAAAAPIYPHVARMANLQGVVPVKVVTDGHDVTSTSVENQDANPVLAKAAQENAQTWKFAAGEPVTFTVTYRYILLAILKDIKSNAGNSKVVLRFPTDVEVYAQRWPQSGDVHVQIKPGQ